MEGVTGACLKVVEIDEAEKALAKKLRMARMVAELANIEAQKKDARRL